MKEQNARMPNKGAGGGRHSDTDSGAGGANHGATGGLKKENPQRADVTRTPSTTNRYPRGLA